jgi:hypothetical protein
LFQKDIKYEAQKSISAYQIIVILLKLMISGWSNIKTRHHVSVYKHLQTFVWKIIVTCMSDSRRGFGLDIGFIGHLYTQLVIILNHSAIAELHTLQIAVTHALVFSVCY